MSRAIDLSSKGNCYAGYPPH